MMYGPPKLWCNACKCLAVNCRAKSFPEVGWPSVYLLVWPDGRTKLYPPMQTRDWL